MISCRPSFGTYALATYTGTEGPDVYTGTPTRDIINGLGGNDELHGGDGDDTIDGGAGDDILTGDAGADDLTGGTGVDLVDGGAGDDFLHVQEGEVSPAGDHYIGGSGTDTRSPRAHRHRMSHRSSLDSRRSASTLPPVWQSGQYVTS